MTLLRNTFIRIIVVIAAALLFSHRSQESSTVAFGLVNNFSLTTTATNTTEMSVQRAIRKVFLAIEQSEGAGARVRRSIGTPNLRNFSPFLMLDHFSIQPGAGFPDQ